MTKELRERKNQPHFVPLSSFVLIDSFIIVQLATSLAAILVPLSAINALWYRTNKSRDASTGPLACPFARSLAPLTRSLAPDCSLRSRPPLRSLVCSLAHFALFRASGTVNDWVAINSVFFSVLDHSAPSGAPLVHSCQNKETL